MRSKLNFLISVSLKRKINTKWFVLANIFLAIIIVGVINIDSVISFFGGDFNEKQEVYVIDNTNMAYDIFNEQVKTVATTFNESEDSESNYEISKYDKSVEDAKEMLEKDKEKALVIVFNKNEQNYVDVELISKEYIDLVDTQLITGAINNTKVALAIYESNISMEQINEIYSPVEITRTFLNEEMNSEDENMEMIMTTVFPVIIFYVFFVKIFCQLFLI